MDGEIAVASRTVSLDAESAERLARLSAEVGCSPEQVIKDALLTLQYVREDENIPEHVWTDQDVADFEEARAEFARGGGISHEQVMAEAGRITNPNFTPEQVEQIERGLHALREGRVKPSSEVFARLEAKYGG